MRSYLRERYTFILEYRGGIYIKQIVATDLLSAFDSWYVLLIEEGAPKNGKKIAKAFNKYGDHSSPTLIDGMEGVWFCVTAIGKKDSAIIHVVSSRL